MLWCSYMIMRKLGNCVPHHSAGDCCDCVVCLQFSLRKIGMTGPFFHNVLNHKEKNQF